MINELNRLDGSGNTVAPTQVKTIGSGKDAIHLTPQQTIDRQKSVGPQIATAYQQVMSSPGYQNLSDANKAKALTNAAQDLNQVQNVKTLADAGNIPAAQKAYDGLDKNQKAMFAGSPSAKDYTALDSGGHRITIKAPKVAKAKTTRARVSGGRKVRVARAKIVKPPTLHIPKIAKGKTYKSPKVAIKKPKFMHIANAKSSKKLTVTV